MKTFASTSLPPALEGPSSGPRRPWTYWLPVMITALAAIWFATKVRVPKDADWDVSEFGRIPMVVGGRHMPVDTMARTALTLIGHKQTANYEPWKSHLDHPKIVSATEWALEVMVNPEVADTRPVFQIDHPELKGLFGVPMEANPAEKADGKHYSWNQLQPHWGQFMAEVQRASQVDNKNQTAYEQALGALWKGATEYRRLKLTFGPAATGDLAAGLKEFNARLEEWRQAVRDQLDKKPVDPEALRWGDEAREGAPLIAPRQGAEDGKESVWATPNEEVLAINRGESAPTLASYAEMAKAYRAGDRPGFASAVHGFLESIKAKGGFEKDLKKAAREQLFNWADPFYWGMYLAVGAAFFAIAFWFSPERLGWARRTAVWLMLLTLGIHTVGLLARYAIEGRPPVTNLYTSAIFIGWGATILGLILERAFPYAVGVMVAAFVEFCALFIAQYLAGREGTTFTVLEAVLNTNFWLATHVVIVTLGYTSTFVAGFISTLYLVFGAFTDRLEQPLLAASAATSPSASPRKSSRTFGQSLATMIYGILCFATLFSFVGTVLGGLWADQSWGRFWGWDVKENGALMIVLWNALVLHARWGGLVRGRGLAMLGIGGNIVTSWSWFGVNNLGIGLHSYGFTNGVAIALWTFVGVQLGLIVLGAITPLLRLPATLPGEEKPS